MGVARIYGNLLDDLPKRACVQCDFSGSHPSHDEIQKIDVRLPRAAMLEY